MAILKLCLYCALAASIRAQHSLPRDRGSGRTTRMACRTILGSFFPILTSLTTDATPGYFSLTLDNDIQMEATTTRRAGLERFTFPRGSKPYFVLDLANDLPASFGGGVMDIDPNRGRVTVGGRWRPR